jgi:hypothetical protein
VLRLLDLISKQRSHQRLRFVHHQRSLLMRL